MLQKYGATVRAASERAGAATECALQLGRACIIKPTKPVFHGFTAGMHPSYLRICSGTGLILLSTLDAAGVGIGVTAKASFQTPQRSPLLRGVFVCKKVRQYPPAESHTRRKNHPRGKIICPAFRNSVKWALFTSAKRRYSKKAVSKGPTNFCYSVSSRYQLKRKNSIARAPENTLLDRIVPCIHIIFARVAIHWYNSIRVYQEGGGFMIFYLMTKGTFRMGGITS